MADPSTPPDLREVALHAVEKLCAGKPWAARVTLQGALRASGPVPDWWPSEDALHGETVVPASVGEGHQGEGLEGLSDEELEALMPHEVDKRDEVLVSAVGKLSAALEARRGTTDG